MSRSTRILFGQPECWTARHPRVMLAGLILLVLSAEKLADLAASIGGAL